MKKLSVVCVIFLLAWLIGALLVGCQKQPELAPTTPSTTTPTPEPAPTAAPPTRPPEIPDGWTLYEGKDVGIRFYYPPEWGEVIDYIDYFKKELPTAEELEGLSKEVLEYRKARIEAFESAADAGQYLSFSNLDMDWGAHIRITSVEKIQSFISIASTSFASQEAVRERRVVWFRPLFGDFGGQLAVHPTYREQIPQMIRDIADLPEGASPEELRDTALPVFFSSPTVYGIWTYGPKTSRAS